MIKDLIEKVFKIPRCLACEGNRITLREFSKVCGKIKLISYKSGTKIQDWIIPKEWLVIKASLIGPNGKEYINYNENNLSVMVNSITFRGKISLDNLKKKIYSIKNLPNAIPYVTSYYNKDWAFCMKYKDIKSLPKGKYFVDLQTKHSEGNMNIGEIFIKGKSKKEIIFTCNICHPQMANNELSGPAIQTFLIKNIKNSFKKNKNFFSYRFLFLPETIGSIAYINKNLKNLKRNCIAGVVLTCLGSNKKFKIIDTPIKDNYSKKLIISALSLNDFKYEIISFNERGSDERQFCSPNLDLPFCSILRTKYGEFKEYHTSFDDLSFISKKGLANSFELILNLINLIEKDKIYYSKFIGEPFLTKHNLKKSLSGERFLDTETKNIINILAYSNGKRGLTEISKILGENFNKLKNLADKLVRKKLLYIKS